MHEIGIGVILCRAIPFHALKAREQAADVDSVVLDVITRILGDKFRYTSKALALESLGVGTVAHAGDEATMPTTGKQSGGGIGAVVRKATVLHNPSGTRERRIAQILHLCNVNPSVASAHGAPPLTGLCSNCCTAPDRAQYSHTAHLITTT